MAAPADCYHCGEPVPDGPLITARISDVDYPMCCVGCKAVAEFIDSSGFTAFYDYRVEPATDLNLTPEASDWNRFDSPDMLNRYVHVSDDLAETTLDIGGMYCSACVWLFDNALKTLDGIDTVDVNPATRRAVIRWRPDTLAFSALLEGISRVGFKPAPVAAGETVSSGDTEYKTALKRLIVAAAAGMQVMMFAVALYAGDYFGIEGNIEKFLRTISLLVTLPIVFYSARPFFAGAWRGLRAREPGMDLPVSVAIGAAFVASTYATLADRGDIYFDSVAMFVFFLSATRFLEMRARHRSDDHALALARLLPDTAIRVTDDVSESVLVDELRPGDTISIRPGDVFPADGLVTSGELSVDESMLTGEAMPVQRARGDDVYAGAIVRRGNAMVDVTHTGASTSLAEIGRMLERAKADRPPIALLADRIASKFVIGVLVTTTLAAATWAMLDPARAFEVALATLVVTCPCALALATPAAIAAATARLAKSGFLLVRARILEVLTRARVMVFDKTGTLTEGRPLVQRTIRLAEADLSSEELLTVAAAIETASEHVLARAFALFYSPGRYRVEDALAMSGNGVHATVDGKAWRIGCLEFVADLSGDDREFDTNTPHTPVFIGDEERVLARFDIGDELRSDAKQAIAAIARHGFRPVIASGDRETAVGYTADAVGIDDWHACLSPADKLELIRKLRDAGDAVIMVGDGINDAPVLAAADASIALDAGTALARASADAVSLGTRLGTIVTAVSIAERTRRTIRQNIAWAIGYNLTAVPLAVSGMLAPWMAAIGMSLSSLVVVLNALRIHRLPAEGEQDARPVSRQRVRQEAIG
jgi:Cu2+-exporting ATPase